MLLRTRHRMAVPRARDAGLTMVEIMVVIAAVSILAAITLSLINRFKVQSQRVICANNLRQWGVAIMAFAQDNRGKYPKPVTWGWSVPEIIGTTAAFSGPGGWTIETMSRYMDGVNTNNLIQSNGSPKLGSSGFTGIWNCPASQWNKAGVGYYHDSAFRFAYSYFGSSDTWSWSSGAKIFESASLSSGYIGPADLGLQTASGNRILMTDTTCFCGFGSAWDAQLWFLNHFKSAFRNEYDGISMGTDGSNWSASSGTTLALRAADNVQKIQSRWAGSNELWGDGRVEFCTADRFDLIDMSKMGGSLNWGVGTTKPGLMDSPAFRWYFFPSETMFWCVGR